MEWIPEIMEFFSMKVVFLSVEYDWSEFSFQQLYVSVQDVCSSGYLGCGVNVTNKDPTMCINDLIQIANDCAPHKESQLDLLTVEEVIARSITALEELIAKFQTIGPEDFKKHYYKYWLHRYDVLPISPVA